ncbi:MAG: translation initiation factor IF-2 [bacterium]|nr:translation initiation factor IF-2 [bacterium]
MKKITRPPVVAILGHVDHGKTTLLDYIRKTHVANKEHGGITQKIGGYEVTTDFKGYDVNKITFIDTPGHEAFSQLRIRGASVADIAILVVDAKDSLMPQTVESIFHIKNAKIPFIVAFNKMDLPDANPNKVKIDLMKYEIITDDKGGTVPSVGISAKTGTGVDELLESILLVASELHLEADLDASPEAYIIEKKKDRRGIAVSAIIKQGSLKQGDTVFAGSYQAKIKALINDKGIPVDVVIPSQPFELMGFNEMPDVGEKITSMANPSTAPAEKKIQSKTLTMEMFNAPKVTEKKLSIIVKADSQGSLEAINNYLNKNESVKIILSTIGDIYRSDIFLAKTTSAIVIGFSVQMDNEVRELAKQEKVIIKTYNIIYELIEELQEVSRLLQEKEIKEKSMKGEAKLLASFIIEGEKIFGVKIVKGKINLGDSVEVYRDGNMIGKSKLVSLKVRAKPTQEVKKDQEAGMILNPSLDIRVGDMIQSIS